MNSKDLKVALAFLEPDEKEEVILQCYKTDNIPHVKRLLRQVLGEPSAMLEFDKWRYGNKTFHIVPLSKNLHGNRNKVFYISYKDEWDWHQLLAEQSLLGSTGEYDWSPVAPLILTDTYSTIDAYNDLIAKGYNSDTVLYMVNNYVWMEV